MSQREYDLGQAEMGVLNALWDAGPATVRQVMNQLHQRGRRVAYTTVLTFLTRLEQKGFVTANKSGLAYIYRAKVSRDRVRRSRAKQLLKQMYDGAAAQLVLQLIRTERFSTEEIAQLQELIDELDAKGRPHKQ